MMFIIGERLNVIAQRLRLIVGNWSGLDIVTSRHTRRSRKRYAIIS